MVALLIGPDYYTNYSMKRPIESAGAALALLTYALDLGAAVAVTVSSQAAHMNLR